MKRLHLLSLAIALFSVGCKGSDSPTDQPTASRTPKTSYGQAVGSAKDMKEGLESRDDEMAKQADELGGE